MWLSQRTLLDYMRTDRAFLRGLSTTELRRRYRAVMGHPAYVGMARAQMRTDILRAHYAKDIIAQEQVHG
jgi:hypothetical protein